MLCQSLPLLFAEPAEVVVGVTLPIASQLVLLEAKASGGHVPEVPVHVSATSHCPADARHVTVTAWYASTQVLLVPEQ